MWENKLKSFACEKLPQLKGAVSQRFCRKLVNTAQLFDEEPFFYHEIALTAPGREYEMTSPRKNKL